MPLAPRQYAQIVGPYWSSQTEILCVRVRRFIGQIDGLVVVRLPSLFFCCGPMVRISSSRRDCSFFCNSPAFLSIGDSWLSLSISWSSKNP